MPTQRKNSWQLLLTTSSNLWQPKERILDNFFLQQVPTYDNPKKEFLTTCSSYNKLQLMMTTQRKNFFTTCSSYKLWQAMEFCRVCLRCVGKLQLWGVRNPLLPQKPWRKLAVNCFPFFPICFALQLQLRWSVYEGSQVLSLAGPLGYLVDGKWNETMTHLGFL